MSINCKTIFCDIDGVIFSHFSKISDIINISNEDLILGTTDKFEEWFRKGYTVVLITGRPESLRSITEQQLQNAGISYHGLIMSLPRGPRVVINDLKTDSKISTAESVNLPRNLGIKDVNI